ncbi:hypothetical protein KDW41_25135 [Burkholderia vietnamiensis]|nr:hypothetical protein [Burkholderia vietnamiensis]
MDTKRKTRSIVDEGIKRGFVAEFDNPESEARFRRDSASHLYFTKLKKSPEGRGLMSARRYALLAAHDVSYPVVLRTFLPPDTVKLEHDPDSEPEHLAFRTKEKVEAGYVLAPKNTSLTITTASEAFKNIFNMHPMRPTLRINTRIDSITAAAILREEQTDSSTDFPNAPWR